MSKQGIQHDILEQFETLNYFFLLLNYLLLRVIIIKRNFFHIYIVVDNFFYYRRCKYLVHFFLDLEIRSHFHPAHLTLLLLLF